MAWLTSEQKKKLIKKTSRNYVFSRFLLFFSITLLVATIAFVFVSYFKTINTYANLHNSGKTSGEIWIEISHFWWSPIKVINEAQYQPGDSIFITFSIAAYVIMGIGGFSFITTIISIILVANIKSPKKISADIQALDDDYWKRQVSKINRIHNLELDAWQEYVEVEQLRNQERILESKKNRKKRQPKVKNKTNK